MHNRAEKKSPKKFLTRYSRPRFNSPLSHIAVRSNIHSAKNYLRKNRETGDSFCTVCTNGRDNTFCAREALASSLKRDHRCVLCVLQRNRRGNSKSHDFPGRIRVCEYAGKLRDICRNDKVFRRLKRNSSPREKKKCFFFFLYAD